MVQFATFTDAEKRIVRKIARRAVRAEIYEMIRDVEMDISATHHTIPLRLADLLAADDFNFGHDLSGIQRHLNRQTGEIEHFFLPRFAQPSA